MKFVTYQSPENKHYFKVGVLVNDDEILDLTSVMSKEGLTAIEVLDTFNLDHCYFEIARVLAKQPKWNNRFDRTDVLLVAPVPRPGKMICIGLNYRDHAAESGMPIPQTPVIFSKFPSCVIGPGEPIVIPPSSMQTDYEAELAFVIGRRARNVRKQDALDYVFGYTNFNDVSARDFQFTDGQWQRGKSCDTFAPMGPFVATVDEIADPQKLSIRLRLNGDTMQDSNTDQMIFGVAELVEFLSRFITLEPGDVVATGTPPGVGFARTPPIYLKDGDIADVEIEGLGVLSNPVKNCIGQCST